MKTSVFKNLSDHRLAILSAAGILALGSVSAWGFHAFMVHRNVTRAEAQLTKGFAALASETLDPYRSSLVSHPKGCGTMVRAYYQARRTDRLEWASQACIESGQETLEAYLGLAGARELAGRDTEAISILNQVATKFDKAPDAYYTMAQILKRLKRDQEALFAYSKAIERAPDNNQLALNTLEYASVMQKWDVAKQLATRLKDVQTDNPEVKLYLARALQKGGDPAAAQPLIASARALLSQKSAEIRTALEKAYSDVLVGEAARTTASESE